MSWDEEAPRLRQRLAAESGERESCRASLRRVRRAFEQHYGRLAEVAARSPAAVEVEALVASVRAVARALGGEVQDALAGAPSVGPTDMLGSSGVLVDAALPAPGSFEVLRRSLQESHTRCLDLNADMTRQVDARDELISTLCTSKDANKRLLEQIRAHTDEITRLTQHRVDDEGRLEVALRRHQADQHSFEEDARQKLLAVRTASAARIDAMEKRLADKRRHLIARLHHFREEVTELQRCQFNAHPRDILDKLNAEMADLKGAVVERVTAYVESQASRRTSIEAEAETLAKFLSDEADARQKEAAERAQRQAVLSVERDNIQATSQRESTLLSTQLQALRWLLQSERADTAEDATRGKRFLESLALEHEGLVAALEEVNNETARMESSCVALAREVPPGQQTLTELRRRIRESADAVVAVQGSGVHLRQQMEEQQVRAQEVEEAEVAFFTSVGEQKLAAAEAAHDRDIVAQRELVAGLEESVRSSAAEVNQLKARLDDLGTESQSLACDLSTIRARYDAAGNARQRLEQELAVARKEFVKERLLLQAALDQIRPQNTAAETELREFGERFGEQRRQATSQETELSSHVGALEDLNRDANRRLADLRNRLAEASDSLDRTSADAAESRRRSAAAQRAGEEELGRRHHELLEARRLLEARVVEERQSALHGQANADRRSEAYSASLWQAKEGCAAHVAALGRERDSIAEEHRRAPSQAQREVIQCRAKGDALELELSRARQLLADSRANLEWTRREREREQQDVSDARALAENELKVLSSDLAVAGDNATLEAKLRAATAQHAEESRRLASEADALRRKAASQEADEAERWRQLQAQHAAQIHAAEARVRELSLPARAKFDALSQGNEQLRRSIGESHKAFEASSFSAYGTTVPSLAAPRAEPLPAYQRMQRYRDELQSDLGRLAVASPARVALRS